MCLICVYVPYLWVGRKDYELVPALCCPCASPFLCLAVPVLLIGSFSFLGTSLAQAQAAPSNVASSAHPDASPQPDVAGPGAYTISFNTGPTTIKGAYHVLIGQQCTATLTLPAEVYGTTVSEQWTASGNTVQKSSWTVSSDDTNATFSGLVNPYTETENIVTPNSNSGGSDSGGPVWYWDDSKAAQTVTCVVTVTPPSGQGNPSTKTVTQSVTVDSPGFTANDPAGAVEFDMSYQAYPNQLCLHAGADSDNVPGMSFKDIATVPSIYTSAEIWYRIQLVSVNRTEYPVGSNIGKGAPGNTVSGALDYYGSQADGTLTYVYNNTKIGADGSKVAENDSPGFEVFNTYQEYKVSNENFQDYIMYHPPTGSAPNSNSIDVPFFYYTWSWSADIKQTTPGSWANYASINTNGTITAPSTPTSQLKYPVWTSLSQQNLP